MKFIFSLCLIGLTMIGWTQPMDYSPSNLDITTETIADGMDIPWGMDWLPDGTMIATEKSGHLYIIRNSVKKEITGLPAIFHKGQGGLLDVAVHPEYLKNEWIYLAYSSPSNDDDKIGTTTISRAKIKGSKLADLTVLYKGAQETNKGYHFGTRIVFDNGYIYFCIGDRGDHFVNPQDITRDGGKIYRLHDDGRIPSDNPFVGKKDAREAIWSYGHRNSQGMIKHPITGEIWEHEHGPMGGDEINILKKGANFGWPVICYGINYDGSTLTELTEKEGMEQPLYYFKPSIGPSGFAFVNTDKYKDWNGSLLIGSLSFNYLERLVLEKNKVVRREKIVDKIGRLRNVKIGPDGFIYIAVEGKGILKLIPQS
jgi:glucose/arabinose dehydrogenase